MQRVLGVRDLVYEIRGMCTEEDLLRLWCAYSVDLERRVQPHRQRHLWPMLYLIQQSRQWYTHPMWYLVWMHIPWSATRPMPSVLESLVTPLLRDALAPWIQRLACYHALYPDASHLYCASCDDVERVCQAWYENSSPFPTAIQITESDRCSEVFLETQLTRLYTQPIRVHARTSAWLTHPIFARFRYIRFSALFETTLRFPWTGFLEMNVLTALTKRVVMHVPRGKVLITDAYVSTTLPVRCPVIIRVGWDPRKLVNRFTRRVTHLYCRIPIISDLWTAALRSWSERAPTTILTLEFRGLLSPTQVERLNAIVKQSWQRVNFVYLGGFPNAVLRGPLRLFVSDHWNHDSYLNRLDPSVTVRIVTDSERFDFFDMFDTLNTI